MLNEYKCGFAANILDVEVDLQIDNCNLYGQDQEVGNMPDQTLDELLSNSLPLDLEHGHICFRI